MPETNRPKDNRPERDANRDPITGAPGSHPVGTGVGAAAGGAAGAAGGAAVGAATGAVGGPVGGAVGAVIGAVAGGLAGKGVAEKVNPTAEEAYWRENYSREPYYNANYSYDDYRGAYQTGYEGYARLGGSGKTYEEVESDLRADYEGRSGGSGLPWEKAQPAVRSAWQRFDRHMERYIGYDVVDRNGNEIGTLECLWADQFGEPAFVGVRTGWFIGKTHVVPAESVEVSERGHRLRLPYTVEKVKEAPAYDADTEMSEATEREVRRFYGLEEFSETAGVTGTGREISSPSAMPPRISEVRGAGGSRTGERGDEARMDLSEEEVKVGKREVEAGGVRLRKVIRTEVVNQPVELRREEVVIERVPASEMEGAHGARGAAFEEEEIYLPLRREEAIVEKESHVRETVRARTESQTETQHISEQVRREDVEIERTGEAQDIPRKGGRSKKT